MCATAFDAWFDYMQNVSASPQFSPAGENADERIAWVVDTGVGIIGTPDDAIRQVARLGDDQRRLRQLPPHGQRVGAGAATRRSVELFAEYVMPVFQNDATSRLRESERWCRERRGDLFDRQSSRPGAGRRPPSGRADRQAVDRRLSSSNHETRRNSHGIHTLARSSRPGHFAGRGGMRHRQRAGLADRRGRPEGDRGGAARPRRRPRSRSTRRSPRRHRRARRWSSSSANSRPARATSRASRRQPPRWAGPRRSRSSRTPNPGAGLQQAINERPDYIAITGIPTGAIKPQLKAAADAKVPVISCATPDKPSPGGYAVQCGGSLETDADWSAGG